MSRADGTRTWPDDWEARIRGKDCAICAEGRPDVAHDGSALIYRSAVVDAYLRRASLARGYSVVVWRGRHVAEPTELSTEDANRYWTDLLEVGRGLEAVYRPAKLNYETWGNAIPHLHTHVIPRYVDDPDPARPRRFLLTDEAHPERPSDEYERDVARLRERLVRS